MDIIDNYIHLADLWGVVLEAEDPVTANALHDQIERLYQEIHKLKREDELFNQVNSVSDPARLLIASHINASDPVRSLKIFEQLTHSRFLFTSAAAKDVVREIVKKQRKDS